MSIKKTALLVCLFTVHLLTGKSSAAPSNFSTLQSPQGLPCELPPPTNFHVEVIGSTFVKYGWILSNAQNQHRIRTYRTSDDALLNTTITAPGVFEATVNGLPENTDMYAVINTICSDGSNGESSPRLDYRTLILELVSIGFSPGTQSFCTISVNLLGQFINSSCSFSPNVTVPFKITRNGNSRQFGVTRVIENGEAHFKVFAGESGNGGSPYFAIYCLDSQGPPCNTSEIIIKNQTGIGYKTCAKFTLEYNNTTNMVVLTCSTLLPNCTIEQMDTGFGRPALAREAFPLTQNEIKTALVSPNPFKQFFDVTIPYSMDGLNTSLKLYNLSGQKVLEQQFFGNQRQVTLTTEDLSPGFYLLRIEADGEVQTLKVVKSE